MALLLAVVAAVGWLDIVTGREIGLSLFYLAPVVFSAWDLGRGPALVVAAAAALAWFAADMYWHAGGHWGVSTWNGLTRLGTFVAMGLLTARVRSDIRRTQSLLAEARMLARTDALTGLANSRWFHESLRERVRSMEGARFSLVYVDVDDFKSINDLAGHERGDQVLAGIARCMSARTEPRDIVARLGGDEFALVLTNRDPQAVDVLVGQLSADVEAMRREHPGCRLGLSAGIVHCSGPADVDDLMRRADARMYEDKRRRKLGIDRVNW